MELGTGTQWNCVYKNSGPLFSTIIIMKDSLMTILGQRYLLLLPLFYSCYYFQELMSAIMTNQLCCLHRIKNSMMLVRMVM